MKRENDVKLEFMFSTKSVTPRLWMKLIGCKTKMANPVKGSQNSSITPWWLAAEQVIKPSPSVLADGANQFEMVNRRFCSGGVSAIFVHVTDGAYQGQIHWRTEVLLNISQDKAVSVALMQR